MHVPVMFPPYVSLAEFMTTRLCINCIRRLSDGKVDCALSLIRASEEREGK